MKQLNNNLIASLLKEEEIRLNKKYSPNKDSLAITVSNVENQQYQSNTLEVYFNDEKNDIGYLLSVSGSRAEYILDLSKQNGVLLLPSISLSDSIDEIGAFAVVIRRYVYIMELLIKEFVFSREDFLSWYKSEHLE